MYSFQCKIVPREFCSFSRDHKPFNYPVLNLKLVIVIIIKYKCIHINCKLIVNQGRTHAFFAKASGAQILRSKTCRLRAHTCLPLLSAPGAASQGLVRRYFWVIPAPSKQTVLWPLLWYRISSMQYATLPFHKWLSCYQGLAGQVAIN